MSALEDWYRRSPSFVQTILLNLYALKLYSHRHGTRLNRASEVLEQSEYLTAAQLRERQDAAIRRVVSAAYKLAPFYRRYFDSAGVSVKDIQSVADLSKLPLVTKDHVRRHGSEMLTAARHQRGWLHGHTSGTTGSPLSLWYDRETAVYTNAVDHQQKRWGGLKRDEWIGMFLGRVIVPIEQRRPPYWRSNLVLRQVWFSCFHMNDSTLQSYIAEITKRRLRYLEGYPSTLFILAQYLLRRGQRLPMNAVFTSSETLHEVQATSIREAFSCEIFDFYGHAERVLFAAECEMHDGKHLAELFGYCEVVDENGNIVPDGTPGYLVGTSLHNLAMPLIRYRTGDISIIRTDACPCGRTHRRIDSVTTKAEDIVVTPDGRLISPSVLTHPFKPLDSIRESQIIQEDLNTLVVRVVADSDSFTKEDELQLVRSLIDRLGQGIDIHIERVSTIPRGPNGKLRWVVSKVEHASRLEW